MSPEAKSIIEGALGFAYDHGQISASEQGLVLDELEGRDTIPSPPAGDSHSGAIVVPRGGSVPPGLTALVQVGGADLPRGAMGRVVGDPIVNVPGACPYCRQLSCSCGETHQS